MFDVFVMCSNGKFKRVESVENWSAMRNSCVLMEELRFGLIYGA